MGTIPAARMASWVAVSLFATHAPGVRAVPAVAGAGAEAQAMLGSPHETDFAAPRAASAPVIVIGFVGGFVNHENAVHSPVQLAARLRGAYPSGVYVQVFENHRRQEAYRKILEILDVARAGKISDQEKREARIIIYGISWGGSETVTLARELQEEKIPVLLTIQVDSVEKLGQNDGTIPSNVAEAANFYQANGMLHGRPEIRAEDRASTQILGNFRYDYKAQSLPCQGYPWYDRMLTKYHTEIECDPAVWNRVEGLIRGKLPVGDAANVR
jgi:hypothetical protein